MSDASFNEQLLTALFDGELQGAERERAENLLAESSEYKELFESWQTQADAFRDLPSYRLDEGFATAVMSEVKSQPVTDSVSASAGAMSNWQSGFAAIATLAAMLLLTLFVFPNLFENTPVANFTPAADRTVDPVKEPLKKDGPATGAEEERAIADVLTAGKSGESGADTTMKKEVAKSKDGVMSRGGDDYASKRATPGLGKSEMGGLKTAAAIAAPNPTTADRDRGNVADGIVAAGNQANAVEQILWIDMQHREKPMVDVADVFARNSIQLLNSTDAQLPVDGLGQLRTANENSVPPPSGAGERMSKGQTAQQNIASRAESNMEALYVVATPTQMRQAIVELSGHADIAGYQVPQNQVNQLVEGGLGQLAETSRSNQESDQGQAVQQQSGQSRDQPDVNSAVEQVARGPLSSAQQLMPFQISETESSQSVAQSKEIQQIDSWFQLPTRKSDTEMVQYLLLVQTGSTDSFSRDSLDASMSEPGDGSADK